MKLKVFSVYDSKAEAYLQPFFSTTLGMATRMFGDAVKDQQHNFNKHAADFTLFQIGEFDDENGLLVSVNKINLGCAIEYLNKEV
ncbi:DNA binding protein vP5 [Microviridae sp.]|nr:DNA binding protein vP5 [Microviridae sp.]UOF82977.1 DNA binding protein vP5 [Microviridae sp.]